MDISEDFKNFMDEKITNVEVLGLEKRIGCYVDPQKVKLLYLGNIRIEK